jgi:hypothetical protein
MNALQQYLTHVEQHLPFGGSRRARILSEIETHLVESWEEEQKQGVPADEALALVLERFGSPTLISSQFVQLEMERRLWQGKQYWQRACLFLTPLLLIYFIAALAFLGYDTPRQVFMQLSNNLESGLTAVHAGFVGVLLLGWLVIGGPLACTISGTLGMITVKNWSRVTWINLMWTILGLLFLLFGIYSLATG